MQELCILCGSHKTRTTPYHPESDGLVERFNRTLLMMLAMFAGKNREDWDDLLPAVMMAYRSCVHESTGFSPYRLMFGEECTLPMDIGLPKQQSDLPDYITSPYAIWVRDALEVAYDQVRQHSGQAVQRQKRHWWKLIGINRGRYCHRVARIILVCVFRVPGGCPFYHRSKSTGGGIKMAAAICTVEAAIFTILR